MLMGELCLFQMVASFYSELGYFVSMAFFVQEKFSGILTINKHEAFHFLPYLPLTHNISCV